jgi:hypothetical protein
MVVVFKPPCTAPGQAQGQAQLVFGSFELIDNQPLIAYCYLFVFVFYCLFR